MKDLPAAAKWVHDGLAATLPPGVPLMFTLIVWACFTAKDEATAQVDLFDGKRATVKVSKRAPYEDAWAIQWLDLDRGAINWNGSAWEQTDLSRPRQLTLFDQEVSTA